MRRSRQRRKSQGFSLIELVVVIAILGILISISTLYAKPLILDARQMAAASHVEAVLKSANVYWHRTGDLPTSWAEIKRYAGTTGPLGGNSLQSCNTHGSECTGEERVIINGHYLITFFVESDKIGVSAWRFDNTGKSADNRSVMGCLSQASGQRIYAWKEPHFYQGKPWSVAGRGVILKDDGQPLDLC